MNQRKNNQFKYYPNRPQRLTKRFAKAEYSKLLSSVAAAESSAQPQLWFKLFTNWNALQSYLGSDGARISHAYNKQLDDQKLAAADQYFREKIVPAIGPSEHALVTAFLNSRHMPQLLNKFGRQLAPLYQSQLKPLDPLNTKL